MFNEPISTKVVRIFILLTFCSVLLLGLYTCPVSLCTRSTNLSPPNENLILSNYLATSPMSEKYKINFSPSDKPMSHISRFSVPNHSPSKTLQ